MNEIISQSDEVRESYQVIITDITWNKTALRGYRDASSELPNQMTYDIPPAVLQQARGKKNVFNDVIESYIYNALTRKFGHEVYHCQIWLPLEDEVAA